MNDDDQAINVLIYERGPERYIWAFRDDQVPALQKSLGLMAVNRDLSFTWSDAARVSQLAKRQAAAQHNTHGTRI